MRTCLLLLVLASIGCSHFDAKIYHRSALKNQILKPRKGYTGLTNRVCLKYDFKDCVQDEIKDYDLHSERLRKDLNEFGFICNLGGRRFKVCLDKPGFCRFEGECIKWHKSFWGKKKGCKEWSRREVYVPVSDYQYLLDADLTCMAQ